jgi:hypothetical protein
MGFITDLASGLIGGVLQYNIDKRFANAQMAFNAAEAEKQRKWQEYMSNTAYQRQVADLKLAGLNPMLAVTKMGGATTPSGAVGSASLTKSMAVQTALQTARLKKELELIDAQTERTKEEARNKRIEGNIKEMLGKAGKDASGLYDVLQGTTQALLQNQTGIVEPVMGWYGKLKSGKTGQQVSQAVKESVKKAKDNYIQWYNEEADKGYIRKVLDKKPFTDNNQRYYKLPSGRWYDLKLRRIVPVR